MSFELVASARVNNNDLHIDAGSLHMPNGEDDELDNKSGHECSHIEVEIPGSDTPNERNGDSVTVPAGSDQPDEENIPLTSTNNPDGEGDPTNGELAARVKFGSKIGLLAAGTSVTGIFPVFSNSCNYHGKDLVDKLFLWASVLFMLVSFVFGVVLLEGSPFFHLEVFPTNNPKPMGRIKFVTGVAVVSIAMVMFCGSVLMIR